MCAFCYDLAQVATGSQGSRAKAQYLGGPTETNAPGQRKHPNAWPGRLQHACLLVAFSNGAVQSIGHLVCLGHRAFLEASILIQVISELSGARYGGASFSVRIPKAGGAMFLFGGQGYGLAGLSFPPLTLCCTALRCCLSICRARTVR